MDQSERIKQCSKCENVKKDPNRGTLCGLTGQKPIFEESCENFTKRTKEEKKQYAYKYYSAISNNENLAGQVLIGMTITALTIGFFSLIYFFITIESFSFIMFLTYLFSGIFTLAFIIVFVNISNQLAAIRHMLTLQQIKDKENKE
jgi:hypothetical protein